MAVLKCTICGGELDVNEDLSIGVCKFCDSTIVIPKNLGRNGNLYNRAVFLRQNSEFDKAAAAYEDILKADNSDAEAHWGLVLSKYGIEYVSDPRTGQKIPTCHRTQATSILSDPDYLAALEYADIEARRVIETEAKRISVIQGRILEISRNEPPYDIFICYKESDEIGNRTEDSTLAQELYYELVKRNYKVFFARKTLEGKLGAEYEPVIYAALNSAKVMVVLGTKAENFNAVWVRNEWSRFLKMSHDAHKIIIPAYRGMSPYELPAELSALQSQDMSKIGFMQDLIDGIERFMRAGASEGAASGETVNSSYGVAPLERLIQNSETYLRLNNYPAAEEVFTTVTKEYPEDYRGWWGFIVCKTRSFTDVIPDQSALNLWFKYVKQLAPKNEFERLEKEYVEYTSKVASLAAIEDMKAVNQRIDDYSTQIREIEAQIKTAQDELNASAASLHHQNEMQDGLISSQEARIKKLKAADGMLLGGMIMIAFGLIILILSIVELINGGLALPGIIIGIIGFVRMLSGASDSHDIDPNSFGSGDMERWIEEAKKRKEENIRKHEQFALSQNKKIKELNESITPIQARIEICRKYLALGKEKIATYWFAEKCAAFGVTLPVDGLVIEYRNAALGRQDGATEEYVSSTCPACGGQITALRRDLVGKSSITCKTCGSTIQVSIC